MSKKTTKAKATKPKALGAAEPVVPAVPTAPEAPEAPKGAVSLDVITGENYIRTYSKAVHGADFKAIAEGFAGKKAGRTLVDSASVKKLEVSWREKQKDGSYKPFLVILTAEKGKDWKEQAIKLAKTHEASKSSIVVRYK